MPANLGSACHGPGERRRPRGARFCAEDLSESTACPMLSGLAAPEPDRRCLSGGVDPTRAHQATVDATLSPCPVDGRAFRPKATPAPKGPWPPRPVEAKRRACRGLGRGERSKCRLAHKQSLLTSSTQSLRSLSERIWPAGRLCSPFSHEGIGRCKRTRSRSTSGRSPTDL